MMTLDPLNRAKDFFKDLRRILDSNPGLRVEVLGKILGLPIILLTPESLKSDQKNYLVAAGFHGNEIAGPLGLLKYLESGKPKNNVSYLPLVNPTGYALNSRFNALGMSPNTGFIHEDGLSEEGQILMAHATKLIFLAKDGFLTLHEDDTNKKFYMYTYGSNDIMPKMLKCGEKEFGIIEKGSYNDVPIVDGLVKDNHDGSFEDFMLHQGIPFTICTETPGKDDLDRRVSTNKELINLFVDS